MKNIKLTGGFLILIALLACGKSDKDKATEKLNIAVTLLAKGDTATALLQLDSVQISFPQVREVGKDANELEDKIYTEIYAKKQDQLNQLNNRLTELEKLFDKEKTEFDRYTQYVHKMQKFERRWNQSYIQLHLNEKGDLYISSNYYGTDWLDHTGIRVYDGIFQAKTDSVSLDDTMNNHHSNFMNLHWEKVNYRNGKDNGVIQFIAEHADKNLKAVFLGKKMYFIVLESFDKQAIKDALALSNALKRKTELQSELKELQLRLN